MAGDLLRDLVRDGMAQLEWALSSISFKFLSLNLDVNMLGNPCNLSNLGKPNLQHFGATSSESLGSWSKLVKPVQVFFRLLYRGEVGTWT